MGKAARARRTASPTIGAMAKKRTKKSVALAYQRADEMGVLVKEEPGRGYHPADNAPLIGPGQVYATRTGVMFHPAWCSQVGELWDSNPRRILVVNEASVGTRRRCGACDKQPLMSFSTQSQGHSTDVSSSAISENVPEPSSAPVFS